MVQPAADDYGGAGGGGREIAHFDRGERGGFLFAAGSFVLHSLVEICVEKYEKKQPKQHLLACLLACNFDK